MTDDRRGLFLGAARPGNQAPGAPTPGVLNGSVEVGLLSVMLMAHFVHTSALLEAVNIDGLRGALFVQYLVFLLYTIVAAMRGQVRVAIAAAIVPIYLVVQAYRFSTISGYPANPNAALAYGILLMTIPFYVTRLPLGTIFRLILGFSAAYCALYLLVAPYVSATGSLDSRLFLPSDGVRAPRAYLAGSFAALVLFTGVAYTRGRPILGLILVALGGGAIYMAQSRMFQATFVAAAVIAVIGTYAAWLRRPMAAVAALAFFVLSLLVLRGFVDSGWNPYEIVLIDASGRARFHEYNDAVRAVGDHWIMGVGIAPSIELLQDFVKPRQPFFPSDLGTAGIFFQFGLIGAVLFVIGSMGCIMSVPSATVRETPEALGFHYATMQAGIYGFFAPVLFGSSASLFAALTLALWLKGGYFRLPNAATAGRRNVEINPEAFGTDVGRATLLPSLGARRF